jgi:S-adenosylmethionine:tRNA ribosyltransferase-isomerase
MLDEIRARGVDVRFVTLHVGLGTFAPVKTETITEHTMHEERYELSEETAEAINRAKREGRRVVAVGTTTVRVLESVAEKVCERNQSLRPLNPEHHLTPALSPTSWRRGSGPCGSENAVGPRERGTPNMVEPGNGKTRIFIYPPREFKIVDALLTNFHLPCSTLLMLVSAFASPGEMRGREMVLTAYAEAVQERYRFFSYGDAMLIF